MAIIPIYPSDLPLPESNGYTQSLNRTFDFMPVETGEPFYREGNPRPLWQVQVTWTFDNSSREWTRFQDWYINSLRRGLLWFRMDLLIGERLYPHECHFQDREAPWTAAAEGILLMVSATLLARYDDLAIISVPPADINTIVSRTASNPAGDIISSGNDPANPPTDIISSGGPLDY